MLAAIALDKDAGSLKTLQNFCSGITGIELQRTFTNRKETISYLRKFPVDLFIIDTETCSNDDLDFFRSIQSQLIIIFIGNKKNLINNIPTDKVAGQLTKPVSLLQLRNSVSNALEKYQLFRSNGNESENSLFIRADFKLIKVNAEEIIFIEGLDDYLKIHLTGNKPIVVRMTMKAILGKLNVNHFIRIHRSFIVPVNKIESVKNSMVKIGEIQLPIGITYEKPFLQRMEN
jgi:DNA-binding LytR/AlgR family response regulator